ncbi:hypothetical protein E2320_011847, partial [Naja naja]
RKEDQPTKKEVKNAQYRRKSIFWRNCGLKKTSCEIHPHLVGQVRDSREGLHAQGPPSIAQEGTCRGQLLSRNPAMRLPQVVLLLTAICFVSSQDYAHHLDVAASSGAPGQPRGGEALQTRDGSYKRGQRGSSFQSPIVSQFNSVARKAVDGNCSGRWIGQNSCTHTKREREPWWYVDLGSRYAISSVVVKSREDCCGERLRGAQIRVGDCVPKRGFSNHLCGTITNTRLGAINTISCKSQVGRYVIVTIPGRTVSLSLCEVEVYGRKQILNFQRYSWLIQLSEILNRYCLGFPLCDTLKQVKQRIKDVHGQIDMATLSTNGSIGLLTVAKTTFTLETYLYLEMPSLERELFVKFRFELLDTNVKFGRYRKIPYNHRTCVFGANAIEDTFHIIFDCSLYGEIVIPVTVRPTKKITTSYGEKFYKPSGTECSSIHLFLISHYLIPADILASSAL